MVAVLFWSDTSPCHEDMDGGHWALSPPNSWALLHKCNIVSQEAQCGNIDNNGDPDHCENSDEKWQLWQWVRVPIPQICSFVVHIKADSVLRPEECL